MPGAGKIGCPQIDRVFFAVSEDIDLDPRPFAGVYRTTVRSKIEGNLDETSVVFETYVPTQPNGSPSSDKLAGHYCLGDAAHNGVSK
ncbi:hypothetical protein LMG27198_34120 [Methylocystis echinoides]|uniref:Uncharacterized protein n=1 Tax=Methylocystis echinoides TaxID=29468 RepID=A0A9W6GWZ5_9HYPH|nr:hypothetical protein LMG27198_34120 [Methylocystis echinoides]